MSDSQQKHYFAIYVSTLPHCHKTCETIYIFMDIYNLSYSCSMCLFCKEEFFNLNKTFGKPHSWLFHKYKRWNNHGQTCDLSLMWLPLSLEILPLLARNYLSALFLPPLMTKPLFFLSTLNNSLCTDTHFMKMLFTKSACSEDPVHFGIRIGEWGKFWKGFSWKTKLLLSL